MTICIAPAETAIFVKPVAPSPSTLFPSISFPWGFALFSCLGFYFVTLVKGWGALRKEFGDTDDALRMVQVRQFLSDYDWYNLRIDRLAPPEGYVSHWSRLPDALMAGIYDFFYLFLSQTMAEDAMRLTYPGLWLIIVTMALLLFCHFWARVSTLLLPLAFLVTNYFAHTQFQGGRIDHHNAQICFTVIMILSASFSPHKAWMAMISGFSGGLLLTIGIEGIPFLLLVAAAFSLSYALKNDAVQSHQRRCVYFFVTLALSSMMGLGLSFRWEEIFRQTACDAIAINNVAALATSAAILVIWGLSASLSQTIQRRFVGLGLSVLAGLVVFAWFDPVCLKGPYGHVNPAIYPIWLRNVAEMHAITAFFSGTDIVIPVEIAAFALPALAATIWLGSMVSYRRLFAFQLLSASFILSLIMGLCVIRMSFYIIWFAVPLLCLGAMHLWKIWGEHNRKLFIGLLALLVIGPVILVIFIVKVFDNKTANAQAGLIIEDCQQNAFFKQLSGLPKGLVMTDVNMGPFILALTPHAVVSAPYHRLGDQIVASYRFLSEANGEELHKMAIAGHYDYIVLCKKQYEALTEDSVGGVKGGFYRLIKSQTPIDWAKKITLNSEEALQIYQVLK